jgi:hypothetical protein
MSKNTAAVDILLLKLRVTWSVNFITVELNFSPSYKPLNRNAGNAASNGASIDASLLKRVTSLLTQSRDSFPLLRHPSVYSCCLATRDVFTSALRSNGSGATLTARKTPLSSTVA